MGAHHPVLEDGVAEPVYLHLIEAVSLAAPARIRHYWIQEIPLRLLKLFATFCLAGAVTLAYFVFFAGAQLTVVNASGVEVSNLEIDYGGQVVSIDKIAHGEVRMSPLGRIGGDVEFDIVWHEGAGPTHQARFGVHLEKSTGYVHVRLHMLPSGGIAMFEGDRQVLPTP
jgi:hypothetical protein